MTQINDRFVTGLWQVCDRFVTGFMVCDIDMNVTVWSREEFILEYILIVASDIYMNVVIGKTLHISKGFLSLRNSMQMALWKVSSSS